mgnify:FL=1
MKRFSIKKSLATVLAACLVIGSTMTVCAAPSSSQASASSGGAAAVVTTTPSLMINGVKAVSTVKGLYAAKSVQGAVVLTPLAELKAAYGMGADQTPYLIMMDTDTKKSHLAMDSLNAAAVALGATMGPVVNINLGAMTAGKFAPLSADGADVAFTVGLPKTFVQADANYAVICVRQGGAVSVLYDTDTDPNTVTFNMKGGLGCYAIVKY